MKSWFQSLAPRERVLVIACGIVVTVFLLYQLIWMPTVGSVDKLKTQISEEKKDLEWFKEQLALVKALEKAGGSQSTQRSSSMSLQTVINTTAKQQQVELERFQSSGDDEITVWVNEAPFDKLLMWLQVLEQRYGVVLSSATISNEGEKPGIAKVRIRLKDSVQ
jgi:general secretion pathway protein M